MDDTGSKPIHAAAGVGDRATLDLLLPCTQPGDGEADSWTAQGLITAARQHASATEAVAGFPEQVRALRRMPQHLSDWCRCTACSQVRPPAQQVFPFCYPM